VDCTGGGGGGGAGQTGTWTAGKKGGSGIVIIRYTIVAAKGTLVLMR
jgi:hypothetical protein